MSVPEGKRGDRKMAVHAKANDLAIYTIKICSNKKVFLPEYQSSMTDDIIRTAKDIFMHAWNANGIKVTDSEGNIIPERAKERRSLQDRAIRECNNLLALMQMAQRLFHLKTRRIEYWGKKTIEVRTLITSWRDADARRYREKLKETTSPKQGTGNTHGR